MGEGWIGVDFDGTLAYYDRWRGQRHAGPPVGVMLRRVKGWLAQGKVVKIFTARAHDPEGVATVKCWLYANGLPDLEVTATKDFSMTELWDDRCVRVRTNEGVPEAWPGD